jgi:virulence-associated protein VapD
MNKKTASNVLLFIIIVLADHFNIVSNQVHRVEANTKLSNKIEVTSRLHLFHKSCKNIKQFKLFERIIFIIINKQIL